MIDILKEIKVKMITALALYNVGQNPFNYIIRPKLIEDGIELV